MRSSSSSYMDPQYLELGRSGAFNGTPSTAVVPANQWAHLAVTVTAAKTVNYYINGATAGSWDASGLEVTINTNLCLANNAINGRKFRGMLDEAQLWSRVLSQTEIQANLKRAYTGSDTNLIAWWQFNNTATNCAPAYPGSCNGTLVNSPAYTNPGAPLIFNDGTNTTTSLADNGSGSLREAIGAAQDGDTIVLAMDAEAWDRALVEAVRAVMVEVCVV